MESTVLPALQEKGALFFFLSSAHSTMYHTFSSLFLPGWLCASHVCTTISLTTSCTAEQLPPPHSLTHSHAVAAAAVAVAAAAAAYLGIKKRESSCNGSSLDLGTGLLLLPDDVQKREEEREMCV